MEWEGASVERDCARVGVEEEAVIDVGVDGAERERYGGGKARVGGGGACGQRDASGVNGEVGCGWESEDCPRDTGVAGQVEVSIPPKEINCQLQFQILAEGWVI